MTRISTKNARLLRQMIEDARQVKELGRVRLNEPGGIRGYWGTVGHFIDYYGQSTKTLLLWQKVRGRVGD